MPAPTEQQTPIDRPQRADARRNREKLIVATRNRMATDGLDAQMDDIARDAGLGVGTLYRHFPTKEALVVALAHARFERLAELANEALTVEDPWEAFETFMRAAAKIQTEDRALSEVLTSRPEVMAEAAEATGILDLTAKVMKRAHEDGSLRADAVATDVPMVMCALAGTYRMPLTNPVRYMTLVLDGFRAPGRTQLSQS